MIAVEHLRVVLSGRVILEDINFEIQPGEVFVILGGSGCGKSTLLRHMIGLRDPEEGRILFAGQEMKTQVSPKLRRQILRDIGVAFQSGALFGSMTILENVQLPLEEHTNLPLEAIRELAISKLSLVGMAKFLDYLPAEVSGGMQKRAAIARAMALDPKVLFLDEPSAGLDPVTAASLDHLIVELSHALSVTFVVVTHELASILAIADRALMLHDGRVVACGRPQDWVSSPPNEVVRAFFQRETSS